jgi:hypothetical protein
MTDFRRTGKVNGACGESEGPAMDPRTTDTRARGLKVAFMSPEDALRIGARALATRFTDADAAFVAGSIVRGEGRLFSDVDLIVLYSRLSPARREAFVVADTPVEAFVHDPETLAWFVDKDTAAGRPTLIGMMAEGRIVGPRPTVAEQWKAKAQAQLARGPGPLPSSRLEDLRYQITGLVDDLRGYRERPEMVSIGTTLFDPLGELLLRARGTWSARGKWIPRSLRAVDADLGGRFDHAFDRLFRDGDPQPIITFVERELGSVGGLLFDGFRREASAAARRAATTGLDGDKPS